MTAPVALTLSPVEAAIESVLTAQDGLELEVLAASVTIATDGRFGFDDVRQAVESLCAAGRVRWVAGRIWKEKRRTGEVHSVFTEILGEFLGETHA